MSTPSWNGARTRVPGRRVAVLLAALLGLPLGAGCRMIEADTYNLDQLHGADGRHRYSGSLEGNLEFIFRHKILRMFSKSAGKPKAPKPIKNPGGTCLKKLLRLASYEPASISVSSRQVEWFSRLGSDDPTTLSRERALLELGHAAERLDVGPRELDEGLVPAGPAALSEALSSLARAVRGAISGDGSREAREADLAAAATVVRDLHLDLDGSRRALRVARELLTLGGLYTAATPPLEELNLHLQRVCIERSLAHALKDPTPYVRAAAIESVVRARGTEALRPHLTDLRTQPPEVAKRVLMLVTELGLPPDEPAAPGAPAASGTTGEPAPDYLAEIYAMLARPQDEGALRVQAMQALSAVAGAGFTSLREEDWQAWWKAREAGPYGAHTGPSDAGAVASRDPASRAVGRTAGSP